MKIKKIIVEIKPLKETLKEFAETYSKLKKGHKIASKKSLSFSDVDTFRQFFSRKRMELLKLIKHASPGSIYKLAQLSDREYKNVHDDVTLLQKLGLVTKNADNIKVEFDKLLVEVEV